MEALRQWWAPEKKERPMVATHSTSFDLPGDTRKRRGDGTPTQGVSASLGVGPTTSTADLTAFRSPLALQTTRELRQLAFDRLGVNADYMDRSEVIQLIERDSHGAKTWVEGWLFEGFFLIVIVANSMVIGWQIDHAGYVDPDHVNLFNALVLTLFTLEIAVKVWVLGYKKYLTDSWNLFDVFVTTLAITEHSMRNTVIINDEVTGKVKRYVHTDFVQIIRLCRLLRFARIFPALGLLIKSFLLSMRSLFWIMVLLFLWFYLSACFATVYIGQRPPWPGEDPETIKELRNKFVSIPMSMLALFEIMTLEGWPDYVRPLLARKHILVFIFCFIFITAFFMLNLVTAVIVDRTKQAQEEDKAKAEEEEKQRRREHIQLVGTLLQDLNSDADEPDIVSADDFNVFLRDHDVGEAVRELGWSSKYMRSIFDSVDHEKTGSGSLTQFMKMLQFSDQPLNTANFMKFHITIAHRLDHQERLIYELLDAVQGVEKGTNGPERRLPSKGRVSSSATP